jgi:hypothetical protein
MSGRIITSGTAIELQDTCLAGPAMVEHFEGGRMATTNGTRRDDLE